MSLHNNGGNAPSPTEFAKWRGRWFDQAKYQGRDVPDVDARINALLELWRVPVPGNWQRTIDSQLLGRRYRRGDAGAPHELGVDLHLATWDAVARTVTPYRW